MVTFFYEKLQHSRSQLFLSWNKMLFEMSKSLSRCREYCVSKTWYYKYRVLWTSHLYVCMSALGVTSHLLFVCVCVCVCVCERESVVSPSISEQNHSGDCFNPRWKNNPWQQCKSSPVLQENHRLGNPACKSVHLSQHQSPLLFFQWCMARIHWGTSNLSAYMADANARIQFISDLFPHTNEAWNQSENIGIHMLFSCLHVHESYPICATWEQNIGIWSLEQCNINAAF